MSDRKYCIVKTTTDNNQVADTICNQLLTEHLAACIQSSQVHSFYRWQGKVNDDKEFQLEIKTRYALVEQVKSVICKNHNYDLPEVIVIPIQGGSSAYLDWIDAETHQ
ncbi:divalent-cation tolerance protein CutA [Thaumasiovibrio sp. DFM-14]|uniref:divalent-cation tolerance protein CutA n=1 Tax=Thaumasiovibrio sp. DFM-14 TaxID=3384792 RepID=UPI0039A02097